MFWQIFLLPQVKRCASITYKHTLYELPHELPNALKLRILGNIKKLSKLYRMIGQCPVSPPKQNFWNVELVPDILWAIVGHPVVLPPHSKNCSTLMQSLYYWISKEFWLQKFPSFRSWNTYKTTLHFCYLIFYLCYFVYYFSMTLKYQISATTHTPSTLVFLNPFFSFILYVI